MAVTRSTAAERATQRPAAARRRPIAARSREFLGLLLGTVVVLLGLVQVYAVKTGTAFAPITPAPLAINEVERREALLPTLTTLFASPTERAFVAGRLFAALREEPVPNVGALTTIRVPSRDIESTRGLNTLRDRLQRVRQAGRTGDIELPLLTATQVTALKPSLVVRRPAQYRTPFLLWSTLVLLGFYVVHLFWRLRGFTGDEAILPVAHLLSGMGLILAISLRDPARDTLMFVPFAQGIVGGLVLLALASQVDWQKRFGALSFVPLLTAIALSLLLIAFGTGPGVSDAKVNLGPVQPIEAIRILLVFFLAGYFARRWEFLRELRDKRPALAHVARHIEIPRLDYLLPVLLAVGLCLVFFFLQKDLGPALVIACVFLVLYAVARGRLPLALSGLGLMLLGFLVAWQLGTPRTVQDRVGMWLSPWDNAARGGNQLAHSLWALAAGGPLGMGLGRGEPAYVPAGHTDLVLSTLGEEWGFVGLLCVFLLFGLLLWRSLRIARRAASDYDFFLALGLTLVTALQLLLIAGGAFGLLPLSGVVTPFISYGRSSMLANFLLFGVLLALSARPAPPEREAAFERSFAPSLRWIQLALAAAGLVIVARLAWVQVAQADATLGAGTLIVQGDNVRRYEYNPRLIEIARGIPRGTIVDRNGLPLASSSLDELRKFEAQYARLGRPLIESTSPQDRRHYPLGAPLFHLLGDLRTRANWAARNSSLAERDSMVRLQGYDDRARVVEVRDPRTGTLSYTVKVDYRELMPLWRHRHEPNHPAVRNILDRPRSLKLSIDGPLQLRAAQILAAGLKRAGRDRGALVVMDTRTGDLLASVSHPWPANGGDLNASETSTGALLDRARYGLYPPGSTFKIVTATAALRRDPRLATDPFTCVRLPDGRVGNFVRSKTRPIRDDIADRSPHGEVSMEEGTVVSCNAYFAQLGTLRVGAPALHETANLFGIAAASPNTPAQLNESLPQASYGQGQVVASPFQMARVAAMVAADGQMPFGRWVTDESNARVQEPQAVLAPTLARQLGGFMRGVVTRGTGRQVNALPVPIAGKTGTAELANAPSHSWFIGYAPHGVPGARSIAFAVIVENGRYGGSVAAPIAGEVVMAARDLGLLNVGNGAQGEP